MTNWWKNLEQRISNGRRWLLEQYLRWRTQASFGTRGERAAERFLKRLGYKIVARQERNVGGELDLIAVDERTIVFVEVKSRKSHRAGHPAEAVDDEKQRRMTRAALVYLKRHHLLECSARFDVVAITWPSSQKRPTIEHFVNAFEAVGEFQTFN